VKVTQTEFDSLKHRYNEVRVLCDSLMKEISELQFIIAMLQGKITSQSESAESYNNRNRIS
jgi:hypothetical protein